MLVGIYTPLTAKSLDEHLGIDRALETLRVLSAVRVGLRRVSSVRILSWHRVRRRCAMPRAERGVSITAPCTRSAISWYKAGR